MLLNLLQFAFVRAVLSATVESDACFVGRPCTAGGVLIQKASEKLKAKDMVMEDSPHASAIHVVITRYKERLDWALPLVQSVVVYDKSPSSPRIDLSNAAEVHEMPNIARESIGYLTYIVEHYDVLPRCVFFMQGGADEHIIKYKLDQHVHLCKEGAEFAYVGLSEQNDKLYSDNAGMLQHWRFDVPNALPSDMQQRAQRVWESFFDARPEPNMEILLNMNACFLTSGSAILQHPKAKYQMLLDELKSSVPEDLVCGGLHSHNVVILEYLLELIWMPMFSKGSWRSASNS